MIEDAIDDFLKKSNAIEGEFSEEAFVDAKKAWNWGVSRGLINFKIICDIHKKLMFNLRRDVAGWIRKCPVMIGGEVRDQNVGKIIKDLNELCKRVPTNVKEIKQWHIDFEHIHPFEDGNGRVGRILMNIQRQKLGLGILTINPGAQHQRYFQWFRRKDGNNA